MRNDEKGRNSRRENQEFKNKWEYEEKVITWRKTNNTKRR